MIQLIQNPAPAAWDALLARPQANYDDILPKVAELMDAVRAEGDAALIRMAATYDRARLEAPEVSPDELAAASIDAGLLDAIRTAAGNIRRFHEAQQDADYELETTPGIRCFRRTLPIARVGLYIPGGSAPLFSTLLMLGIPALIAGCTEIVICTPPQADGRIHPAILAVAQELGLKRIFKAGGAGAIAAMAYGTETVPRVDKIFGPGNRYVTAAKLIAGSRGIAIDMPAGPSELAVIADNSCVPAFVAADLLSQAEHGPDSQVLLLSNSDTVIDAVRAALEEQLAVLPRKDVALRALANSRAIRFDALDTALAFSNAYAPEHLIIACENAGALADGVRNAGSVFLGNWSPESAGDYASGTNHALPTGGAARAWSGVGVSSFRKTISFQEITPAGLGSISTAIETMATAEGLEAHAGAVRIRQITNSPA